MEDLVIVDGYNFIFSFFKADKLSNEDLMYLREKLISDLAYYKHQKKCDIIVVFDAKKSENLDRNIQKFDDVSVIYSSRNETADAVIEELVDREAKDRKVFVVTSDYSQQKVIFRGNIYRKSSREFSLEIKDSKKKITDRINHSKRNSDKIFLLENRLSDKERKKFSKLRKQ